MLTYHWNQGVDDILAMLLAFSAKAEEIEVLLIGVTFGNVEVEQYVTCLVRFFIVTGIS
jgi:inosine-uridine nucleoside N-ribohydrolase